jgi:ribosomal protein L34
LRLDSRQPQALNQLFGVGQGWQSYRSRVLLNRYQVTDNSLRWRPPAAQNGSVEKVVAQPVEPAAAAVEPLVVKLAESALLERSALQRTSMVEQTEPTDEPSFKPVKVSRLNRHIGSRLRLTTHNGRQMEGVLESIEPDRIQLRRTVAQGVALMPVRLKIISQAQVFH